MVCAEAAAYAALSNRIKLDGDVRREIDSIVGIDDAMSIALRARQMACIDLIGKLCLNLRVCNCACRRSRTYRGSDGELTCKSPMPDRLIAAEPTRVGYSRSGVFRKQIKIPAACNVGVELIDGAIRRDRGNHVRPPKDSNHLYV